MAGQPHPLSTWYLQSLLWAASLFLDFVGVVSIFLFCIEHLSKISSDTPRSYVRVTNTLINTTLS